jgi:hypothetical protein
MKSTRTFLAVAVAALLWPHASSAASVGACKVVSSADAAKALGAPVTAQTMRVVGGSNSCTYHTSALPRLSVTTMALASPAEAQSEFHQMVTSPLTQVAPSEAESGIGDETHRLGSSIYVRKGSTIYVFTLISKDANGAGALRTIAAAKASVSHLP